MPFNGPTVVTPYRETFLRFDPPRAVLIEPPYALSRSGNQIARDRSGADHVTMLGTGAWRLASYNESYTYVAERNDNGGGRMGSGDFTLAPGVVQRPRYRPPSDLTGVTVDSHVAAGNNMFIKTVQAGSDWNAGLTADVMAFGRPTLETENVSMSRQFVSTVNLAANEPVTFEFETTGVRVHAPDNLAAFYFGGPAQENGAGQFAILLTGDGRIALWEKVDGTWTLRDKWRFTAAGQAMRAHHRIRIIPHTLLGNRGAIEFIHQLTDAAPLTDGGLMARFHFVPPAPDRHTYPIQFETATPQRQTVTGEGPVRGDFPDDHRIYWAVTRERYFPSGTLRDGHFKPPFFVTPRANLVLAWTADVPDDCTLEGKLYDGATGDELTPVGTYTPGDTAKTYEPSFGSTQYYAEFSFTSNEAQDATPTLHRYTLTREGTRAIPTETEEFTGGVVRDVNISYGEYDPSHETAMVVIDDLQNVLDPLDVRASIPIEINTYYDPEDPEAYSVLFQGFAEDNDAEEMGNVDAEGIGAGGNTKFYPSSEWNRYSCTCIGEWARLKESLFFGESVILNDDGTGTGQGRKVTDVARLMISYAGYGEDEIDVPDHERRFDNTSGGVDDLILQPLTPIGDWAVRTLREWLGWFLVRDGNAGTVGMWRAIQPPVAPYRNLAVFTKDMPSAGKLVHRPESYGSTNWTGTDLAPVVAPILRVGGQRPRKRVKRPEANHIIVTATGQLYPNGNGANKLTQFATNFASVDAATDADGTLLETADPTSPDYMGRLIPAVWFDTTLAGAGDCATLDWYTRRIYDVAAHGLKLYRFIAPLVLVVDTQDALQTRPRPLRFYDPVLTLKGGVYAQWLVRNCNPFIRKDGLQLAYYELESPRIL